MNIIQYKGKLYVFEDNNDNVPDNIYLDRLWFIVKNINKGPYQHIVNLSHIWINNKHYKLEYSPHIMNLINNF